jgi:hypothetical protein
MNRTNERMGLVIKHIKKLVAGVAALAAMGLGAAAIAGAATSPSTTSTTATTTTTQVAPPANMPAHGTSAHENAEQVVTGSAAAPAKAAAVKAAGGGTAGTVTRDFTGSGWEVMVKKADGSTVEIHLDSSLNAFQH